MGNGIQDYLNKAYTQSREAFNGVKDFGEEIGGGINSQISNLLNHRSASYRAPEISGAALGSLLGLLATRGRGGGAKAIGGGIGALLGGGAGNLLSGHKGE